MVTQHAVLRIAKPAHIIVAAIVAAEFLLFPFGEWMLWRVLLPTGVLIAAYYLFLAQSCLAAAVATMLSVTAVLFIMFSWWESSWYHRRLPGEINVDGIVTMANEGVLREGCGAVVFRLTGAMTSILEQQGIDALRQERAKYGDSERRFGEWKATPLDKEIQHGTTLDARSWSGLSCGGLSGEWIARIGAAGAASGSFYAITHEAIVLVAPRERIVVFVHFG